MPRKPLYRKGVTLPERYRQDIEAAICGDPQAATTAKMRLVVASNRASSRAEADLLKRIYRRINV